MNSLILLEKRKYSLTPYHISSVAIAASLLGMLYLFSAIPHFDPSEAKEKLFVTYSGLTFLINILSMASFSILSSVMSAKFIISEYSGKNAILLFSYPIERKFMLLSKFIFVFSYIMKSMILCTGSVLTIFFISECIFPLCPEQLGFIVIIQSIIHLFLYTLLSVIVGIISVWFGFRKFSISQTIVASVIIVCIVCQLVTISLFAQFIFAALVILLLILSFISYHSICFKIENMEV